MRLRDAVRPGPGTCPAPLPTVAVPMPPVRASTSRGCRRRVPGTSSCALRRGQQRRYRSHLTRSRRKPPQVTAVRAGSPQSMHQIRRRRPPRHLPRPVDQRVVRAPPRHPRTSWPLRQLWSSSPLRGALKREFGHIWRRRTDEPVQRVCRGEEEAGTGAVARGRQHSGVTCRSSWTGRRADHRMWPTLRERTQWAGFVQVSPPGRPG